MRDDDFFGENGWKAWNGNQGIFCGVEQQFFIFTAARAARRDGKLTFLFLHITQTQLGQFGCLHRPYLLVSFLLLRFGIGI
jgi:hypothetical protein